MDGPNEIPLRRASAPKGREEARAPGPKGDHRAQAPPVTGFRIAALSLAAGAAALLALLGMQPDRFRLIVLFCGLALVLGGGVGWRALNPTRRALARRDWEWDILRWPLLAVAAGFGLLTGAFFILNWR
jgi:hypothetical protein